LKVDVFSENGRPMHQRGVSKEPGLYFLGLPWLSRRGSSFIWGVWHDAKHISDHIATQRKYLDYKDASQRQPEKRSPGGKSADAGQPVPEKAHVTGVN
jgi:putative flavoprotein involved in K+ transport